MLYLRNAPRGNLLSQFPPTEKYRGSGRKWRDRWMGGSLQQNMEQKCSTNEPSSAPPPHTYFWNHFWGNFDLSRCWGNNRGKGGGET